MRPLRALLGAVVAATLAAAPASARDWRTWPFTRTSPWNMPIGSNARYADIPGMSSLGVSLNYDGHWTAKVAVAKSGDPKATMLFSPAVGSNSTWAFLNGGGKPCGNSASTDAWLAGAASTTLLYPANYYSTLSTPDTSKWLLPPDYHHAMQDFRPSFLLPPGTCGSPDSDGFLSVVQPDGWVLDVYASVVLSGNRVLGTMGSFIDARGDGTGWWSGRRASMLPSFAGLIRTGELASGRIPHALAVQMSPGMMKNQADWPAYAFDRNSGYGGTLPMGALLAIPPDVDVTKLGLTPRGVVLARAAQDYGVYIVDRGGGNGMNFLAELGNPDIRWTNDWQDLAIVKNHLKQVTNNTRSTPGGGGTPRVPLAPPFTPAPVDVTVVW